MMRLVLPELDKERASYGMRERSLADVYSQLLQLRKGSGVAQRLVKWKDPNVQARTGGKVTAAGDFCAVLAGVLEGRCSPTSELSVQDVNDLLDELNRCEVVYSAGGFVNYKGSAGESRRKVFQKFLQRATDVENVWIAKVVLKDMKLGLGHESILRWLHPAALVHYKGTHNLALVCKECSDPNFRVEVQESVSLGAPAEVLLCHRLKDIQQLHDVVKAMPDGFLIEPKFDGERLQLHKMGGTVKCFSRNALDTTEMFGASLRKPVLESVHAVDCILDGEILLWNIALNAFEKFERIRSYVSSSHERDDQNLTLKYVVFDVLYVDQKKDQEPSNNSVVNLSLQQRRGILEKIIQDHSGIVSLAPSKVAHKVSEVFHAMESLVSEKYEGVVVKNPSAKYVLGGRDPSIAVKLKPDYLEGGLDDLDLLILGGMYGGGASRKRAGHISHFVVGVRDDMQASDHQTEEDGEYCTFSLVGRVGSGYSLEQLRALNDRLSSHWISFNSSSPPEFLAKYKGSLGLNRPDVVIHPTYSEVLQIKVYELNTANESPSGITMRFPRVKRLRPDRGWKDAMTLSELRKYCNDQSRKTRRSVISTAASDRKERKRKRLSNSSGGSRHSVLQHFRGADLSSIEKRSTILHGRVYHVAGDSTTVAEKEEVERTLFELGGSLVQNMTKDCEAMIAVTEHAVSVVNWIESCTGAKGRNAHLAVEKLGGPRNVLLGSWVHECKEAGKLVPITWRHTVYATADLQRTLLESEDNFGDSWTKSTDAKDLKQVLSLVSKRSERLPSFEEALSVFDSLEEAKSVLIGRPFHGQVIRVQDFEDPLAFLLRFHGAKLVLQGEFCTHALRGLKVDGENAVEEVDCGQLLSKMGVG